MLGFFYKIQMWFFKKKQLTNVLMERIFILKTYKEFLKDDETVYQEEADALRAKMVKKMEAKEPVEAEEHTAIMELEEKAKKIVSYKSILASSYTAEKEINDFVKIIEKNLLEYFWK